MKNAFIEFEIGCDMLPFDTVESAGDTWVAKKKSQLSSCQLSIL